MCSVGDGPPYLGAAIAKGYHIFSCNSNAAAGGGLRGLRPIKSNKHSNQLPFYDTHRNVSSSCTSKKYSLLPSRKNSLFFFQKLSPATTCLSCNELFN